MGEPSTLGTADVRRLWPQVLEAVKMRRRVTWIVLSQNAQVHGLADGILTLAMNNAGARESLTRGGSEDILREALIEVLGIAPKIESIVGAGEPVPPAPRDSVGAGHSDGPRSRGGSSSRNPGPADGPASDDKRGSNQYSGSTDDKDATGNSGIVASRGKGSPRARPAAPSAYTPEPPPEEEDRPDFAALARENIRPTLREAPKQVAAEEPNRNDVDLDVGGVPVDELLKNELGAQLIDEGPA